MSNISTGEIRHEFAKSALGLIGISIIIVLVSVSAITAITIPASTFQEWNNPEKWISYPKTSIPLWANYFTVEKIPEHKILSPQIFQTNSDNIQLTSEQFLVNFEFDDFPSDFVYEFEVKYSDSYLLSLNVLRPDGLMLNLLTTTLPFSENETVYNQRIFSTDEMIKKNILMNTDAFAFDISEKTITDIIFSEVSQNNILRGDYVFIVDTYGIKKLNENIDSRIILGGKAFGLMGTDELRRDLAVGLLWGTPLALFIGVSVAIGSVVVGLI